MSMTKTQVIEAISARCDVSKRLAGDMVNCFIDTVISGVKKEGAVSFMGFGTFSLRQTKARDGRNPRTGETIKIKAGVSPKFKAGKAFKDAVSKKK